MLPIYIVTISVHKIDENWKCSSGDMPANTLAHTNRQTDTLVTILRGSVQDSTRGVNVPKSIYFIVAICDIASRRDNVENEQRYTAYHEYECDKKKNLHTRADGPRTRQHE